MPGVRFAFGVPSKAERFFTGGTPSKYEECKLARVHGPKWFCCLCRNKSRYQIKKNKSPSIPLYKGGGYFPSFTYFN
jgi:hypothetical protein